MINTHPRKLIRLAYDSLKLLENDVAGISREVSFSRNVWDMVKAGTLLEAEVNDFMIMVPIPKDYFLPRMHRF